MRIVGLTGGIATGKSTACQILREHLPEVPIIDADVLSRNAVRPGNLPHALLRWLLPNDCFDLESGELQRAVLASLIFARTPRAKKLKRLVELCIHPWVILRMYTELLCHWLGGANVVVVDVPLLFEGRFDRLLFTTTTVLIDTPDPELQLSRLMERSPQLSRTEAANRIASQLPMARKRELAKWIVLNDGDRSDLSKALLDLWLRRTEFRGCWFWDQLVLRWIPILGLSAAALKWAWSWLQGPRWG
jgi:dephospho-CoA kinase